LIDFFYWPEINYIVWKDFIMGQKIENAKSLYLEGIRDGNYRQAIEKYTGNHYTQHSTGVKNGKEGFIEFFNRFVKNHPKRDIQIIHAIEDGQYVFLHVYQNLDDGKSEWVTTDFFDTDKNDKIIEHWDVISAYSSNNPSGHSSIDGTTEVIDLNKTKFNKEVVQNLIRDVLMIGGNPENIDNYISSVTYIQHNKKVPDGLEHFKPLALAKNKPLIYTDLFLTVGQGNFVATLCRAEWEGKPYAQVDLFRLKEGLIVEHWDNVEPILPEAEWVNSGKF
jgi:predicted SnoaL-like aldol condensation-catalyzing enzyme